MNEKDFYLWVGNRIRELREKANLKKNDIAKKIGVSPSLLTEAENDGKKLSAWRIKQILEAMGYSPEALYVDDEKKTLSPLRFQVEG
ncbi:MAG: helix-turn-helix transcriptional regulator [Candidatus Vecturithrix sp.]|jgi:transcriptional regulator with XRE-family HTH domain|nr:helix-turn-helix transcriptional regulator [Candidatus Vecturithrix sp.]